MTNPRFRTLIIGAGAVADLHAAAVATEQDIELVGIVDSAADRAAAFAGRWHVPAFVDLPTAVTVGRPNVVHICAPTHAHAPLARAAVDAGCAVLLEKPPGLSLSEVQALDEAAAATGIPIAVVLQHRFGSGAVALRGMADEGQLGRPLTAVITTAWDRDDEYFRPGFRGTWALAGGGPTMNLGIHQIDLALSLLGPWWRVAALTARTLRKTETEDASAAAVQLESGVLMSIMNSAVSTRQESSLRIDFEFATIELSHLYEYGDDDWRVTPRQGHESIAAAWQSSVTGVTSSHLELSRRFYQALRTQSAVPVSLRDAAITMSLIAGIYASSHQKRVVTRDELRPGYPFWDSMHGD